MKVGACSTVKVQSTQFGLGGFSVTTKGITCFLTLSVTHLPAISFESAFRLCYPTILARRNTAIHTAGRMSESSRNDIARYMNQKLDNNFV